MSEAGYRILLVEDEDTHAELVRRVFHKLSPTDTIEHVRSAEDCLERVEREYFDLLIVDYSLPDLNGVELMEELQRRSIGTPIIIITGRGDENIAVQVMKLGATDYIVKAPKLLQSLPTVGQKAIERHQLKRRFEEAEAHLRFQALLLENVHEAIIGTDLENEIIYWNSGAERIFGHTSELILGSSLAHIFPDAKNPKWLSELHKILQRAEINNEWQGMTVDHQPIWLSVRSRLIADPGGARVGVLIVAQDITEQKKLKEQTDLQEQNTAIINQILTTITATIEIDEMLTQIVALLASVFECDRAWVEFPCGSDRPRFSRHVEAGSSPATELFHWNKELGSDLASEFFAYLLSCSEQIVSLDEKAFAAPAWREFLRRHSVQSQLLIVLRPRTSRPWLLGLWQTECARHWTEPEKELLAEIGHIVTVAIEKSLLYQRAQEAAAREQLINRITQAISQSLDIHKILQTVCEELGKNLHADRCYFADIMDPPTIGVITHEYLEPGWPSMVGHCYVREQFGSEIEPLLQGRLLAITNIQTAIGGSMFAHELESLSIKSLLIVPVLNDGHLIGAIGLNQCSHYREWSEDDIGLAEALARQCAIALHNARLYSQSRKSEERYRSLFENDNDAILIADVETGTIIDANSKAETLTGHNRNALFKMHLADLHPEQERKKYQGIYRALGTMRYVRLRDATVWRKDGTSLPAELNASVIGVGQEAVIQVLLHDMTEQRKLEGQLLLSQRLESIGTLTGGIAHDFNNLLAGILGYAELLKKKLHPGNTKLYNYAGIIEQSATRGAELAQRLVTFARGGNLKPQTIDLNAIVEDTLKLLTPALGRTIEVQAELDESLSTIEANGTQLQQILMNLCINARDAMLNGGQIDISTENFHLAENGPTIGSLKPGGYVILTVTDTGLGMDQQTMEQIFEPFFTTKELGKGTGLGLAMVTNIVREIKGHIEVKSEIGRGTTFRIYLPASVQSIPETEQSSTRITGGTETILVVDDEETLRYLAKDLLEAYGYRVLLAADGAEAIDIYHRHGDEIALVLLDMVMPRMGGRELYKKLLEINPKAKVVLASGYCSSEVVEQIWKEGIMGFVQKPYQIEDLAAELRLALDRDQ